MSDASDRAALDFREQITRIDRSIEETRKFTAEAHKLTAEAAKLERDRWWTPWVGIGGLIGGLVAAVTLILHALGKV